MGSYGPEASNSVTSSAHTCAFLQPCHNSTMIFTEVIACIKSNTKNNTYNLIDLYGADDNEFAVPVEPEAQPTSSTEEVKTSVKEDTIAPPAPPPPQSSRLSPSSEHKPTPAASIPSVSAAPHIVSPTSYTAQPATAPPASNGTPYSTQVSQQFSTYQHTTPLGSDRQDHLPERAEIPQVDTTGERSHINVVDRSVRPSEMKDEG